MKSKMQKFRSKRDKVTLPKKGQLKKIQEKRKKNKVTDDAEIEKLSSILWPNFDEEKKEIPASSIKSFTDLPLSTKTKKGLEDRKFTTPTDIQRESLMFALKGHDILGAAKTGSGKTLAFLIPVLELLFRQRFSPTFGLAALIVSPTRELAFQSYDTLIKIGKHHQLSFALITGGMPLKEEASRIANTNVVICTPGRFQQHIETSPDLSADELKILVLDEADKILHMGFAETMNAIITWLPKQRQTLLFSATQTKSVKDLARLSLKRPVYVSVHEKAKETTPSSLEQRYILCEMEHKINTLWSFIMTHKHQKILTFMSCCKQVRYVYNVFRKMQPGLTVLALHGHMKQHQRMAVYRDFTNKQHAVLLATDVAARGLDFPSVGWVVQVDRPDSTDTYIHRVGRTARYEKSGQALLFLLKTEEKQMVDDLMKRKIPIKKIRVSKKQVFDVTKRLESLCASEQDIKDNAQKAFLSVMKTLSILDTKAYKSVDQEAFAKSLGLVQAPKQPSTVKRKSVPEKLSSDESSSSEASDSEDDSDTVSKKTLSAQKSKSDKFDVDSDEEGLFDVVKDVKAVAQEDSNEALPVEGTSKKKKTTAREKLKLLKHAKRTVFNDDGDLKDEKSDEEDAKGLNLESAKQRLREQDKLDREAERQRIKLRHREKRLKEKEKRRQAEREKRGISSDEPEVRLGDPDGDYDDDAVEEEETAEGGDHSQAQSPRESSDEEQEGMGSDEDDQNDSESEEEEEEEEEDDFSEDDDANTSTKKGHAKKRKKVEYSDSEESDNSDYEHSLSKRKKQDLGKLTQMTEDAALALLG